MNGNETCVSLEVIVTKFVYHVFLTSGPMNETVC